MKLDNSKVRSAVIATALAGAMVGVAALPAAARGYVTDLLWLWLWLCPAAAARL